MIDFFLNDANLPFTIALGLMLGIGLIEGTTTLMGFGASGVLDSHLPDFDVDADLDIDVDADADIDADVDADVDGVHGATAHGAGAGETGFMALSKLMIWFNIGKVPILILLVIFLFGFGLTGLFIQWLAFQLSGHLLPGFAASIPSFLIALGFTKGVGQVFARLIPKDESEALSESSFIGLTATISLGAARMGKPTQAKLVDRFGRTHYVMVEPDREDAVLEAGSTVRLVERAGAMFKAVSQPLN